jgi:hypothetical protein
MGYGPVKHLLVFAVSAGVCCKASEGMLCDPYNAFGHERGGGPYLRGKEGGEGDQGHIPSKGEGGVDIIAYEFFQAHPIACAEKVSHYASTGH